MKEIELYQPMCQWLESYMKHKFIGYEIITIDAHNKRLDRVLNSLGIEYELAIGIDIQIDVLGIARKNKIVKLVFIEAKITNLRLKDLGQLWAYSKLIDPDEAFLLTSKEFGSLDKILKIFNREDMLDFGDGRIIKKMKVGIWDTKTNSPIMTTIIPKI
jgi:hypothetical protein